MNCWIFAKLVVIVKWWIFAIRGLTLSLSSTHTAQSHRKTTTVPAWKAIPPWVYDEVAKQDRLKKIKNRCKTQQRREDNKVHFKAEAHQNRATNKLNNGFRWMLRRHFRRKAKLGRGWGGVGSRTSISDWTKRLAAATRTGFSPLQKESRAADPADLVDPSGGEKKCVG